MSVNDNQQAYNIINKCIEKLEKDKGNRWLALDLFMAGKFLKDKLEQYERER